MGFIGDAIGGIFGKGGDSAPDPVMPQMPDYSGEMMAMMGMMQEMMGGMMEGMMGQMMGMAEQQQSMQENMMANLSAQMDIPLPQVYRDPEIDFGERQDQLAQRGKADFHRDQMLRKGRLDTVLTSPLLDEEEGPALGGSVLSGE